MSNLTRRAREIYRDHLIEGDSGSGLHQPAKAEIRQYGLEIETALDVGFGANASAIHASKAALDADLTPAAGAQAWVFGDATEANNGVYKKTGASGTGSWSRVTDLPFSIIPIVVSGGTANAIVGTTTLPIPATDMAAILLLTPSANNTGAVTLSLNGGAALALTGPDGGAMAAGYLAAGAVVALFKLAGGYRTLNDARVAALAAAAAASATAAATSATAAAGSATASASSATAAGGSATAAANSATAVALLSGVAHTYVSYAALSAALSGIGANDLSLVLVDETRTSHGSIYQKVAGVATFIRSMDVIGPFVSPADFGAQGNGTTDDTTAILAAIATGKTLFLETGKTYLISAPLSLNAGQGIIGNTAKFKRANQLSSTTTTTITAGVTNSIVVADPSKFRAGQQINILNGSTYDKGGNRTITSVVGSTLTLSSAFSVSVSGTTTVYVSYVLITTAADCAVRDVHIDGNRANWPFRRWEVTCEIEVTGSRTTLTGNYLYECPGEGIMEISGSGWFGLTGNAFVGNRIVGANGNGFHMSGSDGTTIAFNYIDGCNADTNVGHVSGGVGMSQGFRNYLVIGNVVKNCYAGVGPSTTWVTGFGKILNNTIEDCTVAINVYMTHSTTGTITDMEIEGNTCRRCGSLFLGVASPYEATITRTGNVTSGQSVVSGMSSMANVYEGASVSGTGIPSGSIIVAISGSSITIGDETGHPWNATATNAGVTLTIAGSRMRRIQLRSNRFHKCGVGSAALVLQRLEDVLCDANEIIFDDSDTTSTGILISGACKGLQLINTRIRGGETGISVADGQIDLTILGSRLSGQSATGIYAGGTASTNQAINNNQIRAYNAGSSYRGISLGVGMECIGNSVVITGTPNIGIEMADACVVTQNKVMVDSGSHSIKIYGGTTGYVVSENRVSKAITNSGTPVRAANNDIVTA